MPVRRLLLLSAMLGCAAAVAQTPEPPKHAGPIVYKCVNADGSVVYSESACSADPSKVKAIDTSPALRTGSGGHTGEIAASVADSDCRERAFKSTHADEAQIAESNRHIADYERRKQELQAQGGYAAGSAAPAASDATAAPVADNSQALADLDASIAAEREFQAKASANNDAAYQAALRQCDEALRKNTEAAAPAAKPAAPPATRPKDGGR